MTDKRMLDRGELDADTHPDLKPPTFASVTEERAHRKARLPVRALFGDAREGRRLQVGMRVGVELAAVEHAFVRHCNLST